MTAVFVALAIAVALSIPFIWVARSNRRLTWTTAVVVGSVLASISLILLGDIPSRLLYYFDAHYIDWATRWPGLLGWLTNERLFIAARDGVVNTVQVVFFILLLVVAYIWGQRQVKAGRFRQ